MIDAPAHEPGTGRVGDSVLGYAWQALQLLNFVVLNGLNNAPIFLALVRVREPAAARRILSAAINGMGASKILKPRRVSFTTLQLTLTLLKLPADTKKGGIHGWYAQ